MQGDPWTDPPIQLPLQPLKDEDLRQQGLLCKICATYFVQVSY